MVDPLTIVSAVGAASKLFGRKKRRNRYSPRRFEFDPDENDPELSLLRRRALEDSSRSRAGTINEIGRAGLLGSSAAFGILEEADRNKARVLEDIDASTLLKQRATQLDLFRDEENFRRQMELLERGNELEMESREGLAGLESLLGLGESGGGLLEEFFRRRRRGSGTDIIDILHSGGLM